MATFTKSTSSYNPFKDTTRTFKQKIELVFTERQMTLVRRPDVTKSLILACTKVVEFKQPVEEVVSKWVGKETEKFIKTIPLITVRPV